MINTLSATCRQPILKKVKLYAEYDGKIKKLKAKKFGSYLEFEIPANSFTLYETQKNYILGIVLKITALRSL
ncbi:MAG: hypothetical protein L6V93_12005 [Clostridiales bacterium]|nr:MAG: hypothetical protein L6V93_12005 [Clostridiales bacterium]